MEKYPPFDSDARCPKCAYDAITTKYEYAIAELPDEEYVKWVQAGIALYVPTPRPERLRRTCARCSHYWFEGVLDAQPG
jgi:hypothetical protein